MLHTSFLHRETLSTCDAQLWLKRETKQTPEHLSSVLILSCCFSVIFRDVGGETCSVGECSHACEAGEKALSNGLLDSLSPKSSGLQLHQVVD